MVEVGDDIIYEGHEGVVLEKRGDGLVLGFKNGFSGWPDKRWPGYDCWAISGHNVKPVVYDKLVEVTGKYEI